jgi:hypothetical protein
MVSFGDMRSREGTASREGDPGKICTCKSAMAPPIANEVTISAQEGKVEDSLQKDLDSSKCLVSMTRPVLLQ